MFRTEATRLIWPAPFILPGAATHPTGPFPAVCQVRGEAPQVAARGRVHELLVTGQDFEACVHRHQDLTSPPSSARFINATKRRSKECLFKNYRIF
mmetsp:Transcript_7932/g.23627  ORF Transcript_7932/g.23627 Transcript_7932/m.23627 type:complete len:96 (-) Transcript_7932:101-388(-)